MFSRSFENLLKGAKIVSAQSLCIYYSCICLPTQFPCFVLLLQLVIKKAKFFEAFKTPWDMDFIFFLFLRHTHILAQKFLHLFYHLSYSDVISKLQMSYIVSWKVRFFLNHDERNAKKVTISISLGHPINSPRTVIFAMRWSSLGGKH